MDSEPGLSQEGEILLHLGVKEEEETVYGFLIS